MSIIDTLITNRTQADVDALQALYAKPKAMWTAEEWDRFLLGNYRGAYNASDMNRVLDALDYLAQRVTEFGYGKPEIKRPSITEVIPGTSKLPEGYTELKYIQSTGTQHIDTDVIPSLQTTVRLVYQYMSVVAASGGSDMIAGVRSASGGQYRFYPVSLAAQLTTKERYVMGNTLLLREYDSAEKREVLFNDNNHNVYVDGNLVGTLETFTPGTKTMWLFAANSESTSHWYSASRIYECQIYENGTLIRDYIPCLNPSNEAGLYDLVTKSFFGNAGTGQFIAGTAGRLPDGYTELEHIRSTGTQYTDTGFKPNQDTRVVVDARFTGLGDGRYIVGARAGWANAMFAIYAETNGTQFLYGHGSQTGNANGTVLARHTFDLNKNSLYIDGVLGITLTANSFQSANSLYLFSCNQNGSPLSYTPYLEIYSCQIYDNGVLVRDYVPCINASHEVGLYDIVNNVFYGNAGSGYFLPGPVASLPVGYTRLEFIESTGTQHIDAEVALTNKSRVIMDAELLDYATNTYENSFFGARSTGNTNMFLLLCGRGSAESWDFMYGAVSKTGTIPRLGRHSIDVDGATCVIDGTIIAGTESTFSCDHNCYLFTDNKYGSANTINNSRLKLYSCLIYDNDVLIRLYTPVKNAIGDIGLYDSIDGVFYGNAGAGSFAAGAELSSGTVGSEPSTLTQTIVRDYYAIGDCPPVSELAEYLANVERMRNVLELPAGVPAVPEGISKRITVEDANNIEIILTAVEVLLNRIALSRVYSGEFAAGEV